MKKRDHIPTTSEQVSWQSAELVALRRMLNASQGTFSLSIAVCNSPSLRDYLIAKLKEESQSTVIVEINRKVTDVLDFVRRNVPGANNTGIFITGIEKLLPSEREGHKVLQVLNATRELWRSHFSCPVVFWLPEYAATLFSIHARDMWSWLSHSFEFISEQATASAGMLDTYAGDIISAGRLDADQKRFRIAELEQRINDAGEPPKQGLAQHVLTWLNELAYIYKSIGELDKSKENVLKLLKIAESLGLQAAVAGAYGNLGVIYRTRGELDKAEEMHRKSLEIEKKLGRLEGMASDYLGLGNIYYTRGDLDKAEEMHKKSVEINKQLGRKEGMASNYGNLGSVYLTRGELDKAEEMYLKSLEIAEKLGLQEVITSTYGNLGIIYRRRGELDKAEEMHKKSLEIKEKLGLQEGIANSYGNLGTVYEQRGDIGKAREYWQKALELFKKIGMQPQVEKVQGLLEGIGN